MLPKWLQEFGLRISSWDCQFMNFRNSNEASNTGPVWSFAILQVATLETLHWRAWRPFFAVFFAFEIQTLNIESERWSSTIKSLDSSAQSLHTTKGFPFSNFGPNKNLLPKNNLLRNILSRELNRRSTLTHSSFCTIFAQWRNQLWIANFEFQSSHFPQFGV